MDRPELTRTFVRFGYARGPVDEAVERILRRDPALSAAHVAVVVCAAVWIYVSRF